MTTVRWQTEQHGLLTWHWAVRGNHKLGAVFEGHTTISWQLHLPTHPTIKAGEAPSIRQAKAILLDQIDEWFNDL